MYEEITDLREEVKTLAAWQKGVRDIILNGGGRMDEMGLDTTTLIERHIDELQQIRQAFGLHDDTDHETLMAHIQSIRSEARNYPNVELAAHTRISALVALLNDIRIWFAGPLPENFGELSIKESQAEDLVRRMNLILNWRET